MKDKIVVRFAPSPTGPFHVGGARTALFNFIFAQQRGGKFILRIEDTDQDRSRPEYEQDIVESLRWLGITPHEFFRQSERKLIYERYLKKLIDTGYAYVSQENQTFEPKHLTIKRVNEKRREVIRFKNPNKKITFRDIIKGEITFDTTELGDFVVAKSLTEPIFHLAVVIDDFEMGITQVIRGEDHIANTPRQILIQEAIGAPRPDYAHIPLILSSDRSKLSKRKHGESVSVSYYRENGFLPEAMINFLAFLGWNPGDGREIMSLEELIKDWRLEKVQKSGAIWGEDKLRWLNREYIRRGIEAYRREVVEILPEKFKRGRNEEEIKKLLSVIFERLNTLGEFKTGATAGEWDFLIRNHAIDYPTALIYRNLDKNNSIFHLEKIKELISELTIKNLDAGKVKEKIFPYAEKYGRQDVLWPLRVALSGKDKSPDPFTLIELIGKDTAIDRINVSLNKLKEEG
jgi:glutamyl-tRNA synthetase